MNWGIFLEGLNAVPYIVELIEKIHGDTTSNATKQQTAVDALAVVTGGADSLLNSNDQTIANAASALAKATIDNTVAVKNTVGTANFVPAVIAASVETLAGVQAVVTTAKQ